jgi:hypothetical protein
MKQQYAVVRCAPKRPPSGKDGTKKTVKGTRESSGLGELLPREERQLVALERQLDPTL